MNFSLLKCLEFFNYGDTKSYDETFGKGYRIKPR